MENADRLGDAVLGPDEVAEVLGAAAGLLVGECGDRRREALFGHLALRDGRGAGAEAVHPVAPEGLIAEDWADQGGAAGPQSGDGGAGAAMVDDGGGAWEQPVVRNRLDDMNVVIQQIVRTGRRSHPSRWR